MRHSALRVLFVVAVVTVVGPVIVPAEAAESLSIATVNGRSPAEMEARPGRSLMVSGTSGTAVSSVVADAGDSALVEVGTSVRLAGAAVGGEAPYTFAWSAPVGTLRDADGPAVTFDATDVAPGAVTVTLTATDASGRSGTDTVRLWVYEYQRQVLLDVVGEAGAGIPDELLGAPFGFDAHTGGNIDRQSFDHPFTVPADARDLEVSLDWGTADNDFDLYLKGEDSHDDATGATSAKPEVMRREAPARDYQAEVHSFLTVPDTYHLVAAADVPPAGVLPELAPLNPYRFEVGDDQVLDAEVSGGAAPVVITWDLDGNGSYETTGPSATTAFPLGTHFVTAKATDAAGFESRETIPVRVVPPGSQLASPHFVVIAINDTGINPYHRDYSAETYPDRAILDVSDNFTRHPSDYLPGYPAEAEALPVTLGQGFMPEADCPAGNGTLAGGCVGGLWTAERIEQQKLYWIPGTKIIGAISHDPFDHPILDDNGHGTGASSVSAGNTYGSCPSCLIVFDEGFGSEWTARQPWIDFVSNSYGNINVTPDLPVNLIGRQVTVKDAVERGQTWLFAAGNGHGNAFVIPNTSYTQNHDAPDWIMRVGAIDSGNRQPVVGDGMPADVSSFGVGPLPSASFESAEGIDSFGGTSAATPITSGVLGLILREARAALGDHRSGQRGPGVIAQGEPVAGSPYLGDGVLTRGELWELGLKTARPGEYPATDASVFAPTYPAADFHYLFEGYGIADEASAARAIRVMFGSDPLPARPEEDEFFARDSALRVALHGSWTGYEEQYGEPGADQAAALGGLGIDAVDTFEEAMAILGVADIPATTSSTTSTSSSNTDADAAPVTSQGSTAVAGLPFLVTSAVDGKVDAAGVGELAVAGNAGTRSGTDTIRRYARRLPDGAGGCTGKEYLADQPGSAEPAADADPQCSFTAQSVTLVGQGFGDFENSYALESPLPIRLDGHRPVTGSLNIGGAGASPDTIFLVGLRTGGAIIGWQRVAAPIVGNAVVKLPFSFPISPRFANVELDRLELVVGLRRSNGLLREQLIGPDATYVDIPLAPASNRVVALSVDGVAAGQHPVDERDGTWGTNLAVGDLGPGVHEVTATLLTGGTIVRSETTTVDVVAPDAEQRTIEVSVQRSDGGLATPWTAGVLDKPGERWLARTTAPTTPGSYLLVARIVRGGKEVARSAPTPLTVS